MHFDSVSHQLPIADEFEPPEPQDRAARRLWGGLLVSFIVHAFILSLQFGIPGLDLPSLELPWKEKRKHVDGIQVQISLPAPAKQAAPAAPAVTVSELFKLPDPILPTPQSKPNGGIVIVPRVVSLPAVDESKARSSKTKPIARQKSVASAPPVQKKVLPPPEAPVRVITQDQVKNEDFVVPVTSPEELERQREDKKEQKRQAEPIPADALIDKDAEAQLQEEKKRAELAAKKAEEEQQHKKQREEEQRQAELKRQEELRLQRQIAQANEEQQKRLNKLLEEKAHKASDVVPIEPVRELNEQKQLARQRAVQALAKREQEQAMEEALQEAKRKELLAQETLRQEEQRRQAERERQRQLALEQEQQMQREAAARQKEREEQERIAKQQALALAEKKAQEQKQLEQQQQQLAERRAAEQKLAEQKLAEQKAAEQKLAEQRLAEQRLAEQKLAEQKAAEQRLAAQKAAADKLAAEKAAADKLAADKAAADALAKANADRAAAQAGNGTSTTGVSSGNNRGNNPFGNGSGEQNVPNPKSGTSLPAGDLASRLREQVRSGDLLKPRSSISGIDQGKSDRRRSFLGAYDKEVPLRMYVDSVRAKWERNGNLIYEKRSIGNTELSLELAVTIKSDGSVEEVSVIKSSGNRATDERARNIAITNAPYSAFPPALAAKYGVIEVKHVWIFGDRLRILDDLPQF